MKGYKLFGLSCAALLTLNGCLSSDYYHAHSKKYYTQENWLVQMNINPSDWTAHTSPWFSTGEPNDFGQFHSTAPLSSAMTAMMVRVPDFTHIQVKGPFKLQIFGHQDHNSLFVLGPNEEARKVNISVHGNSLLISPQKEDDRSPKLSEVVIRIGVRDLTGLLVEGNSDIEANDLTSSNLDIRSLKNANMVLAGNMNVSSILEGGNGTISILGATTPSLKIRIKKNGTVNVSGRVGIEAIDKRGSGNINIVGADSNHLHIKSSGSGKIAIAGYANLQKVDANEHSQIAMYWINSNGVYANLHDHATLSLAGVSKNLNLNVTGNALFFGKYLRVDNVYAQTAYQAHANVTPVQKLFANATENSSIYFYGSPNVVSRYATGYGTIIPVWSETAPTAHIAPASSWSWKAAADPFRRYSPKGE